MEIHAGIVDFKFSHRVGYVAYRFFLGWRMDHQVCAFDLWSLVFRPFRFKLGERDMTMTNDSPRNIHTVLLHTPYSVIHTPYFIT